MTIQEYARAVAEAVLMVCEESGLPDMDAEDVRESLSDIIASVPRPTAQHHDAPTCLGWWWARRQGTWEAVRVTGWEAGHADRHVTMVSRSYTGAVVDRWVGPLLPPDTTEPAPDVQAHCVGCGHAAHALDCSEQGCLCPHSTDVQAYKEMYECGYEAGRDEVQAQAEWCARLPDGSGAAVVSFPLPDNHWLTAEHENVPPMPFRMGTDDPRRTEWKNAIRDAGKYAVRCATMNGADNDFDPDALVQNLVVGMIGYFTPDGFSSDAWANPEQPTPAILTDTDAAVAREREECARECERIAGGKGMSAAAFSARVCASNIRARSAKGV